MEFKFIRSPLDFRVLSAGTSIIHCCDGSVKRNINHLLTLNKYLINVYDGSKVLHFALPFCTTSIITLIYELMEKHITIKDINIANKVIETIKLLGGQVHKDNSNVMVQSSFNELSSLIVTESQICDVCVKTTRNLIEANFINQCTCRSNFPFTTADNIEIWKRAVENIKFIDPIPTRSPHPCLNGEITSTENSNLIDITGVCFPHKSRPDNDIQIAFLKAIKLKKFPFLSLHNLSIILNKFPCLGTSTKDPHICIFCGKICNNKNQLLFHIQRHHTGFAIKCDICQIVKADEYLFIRHRINKHKERNSLSLMCSYSHPIYDNESLEIGSSSHQYIITNKKNYGTNPIVHLTNNH